MHRAETSAKIVPEGVSSPVPLPKTPPASLEWHHISDEELLRALKTDSATGLTASEAQSRLEQHGFNELVEQPRPGFATRLFSQFKSKVVLLLVAACLISGLLGEWPEAAAILLIVVLNAILGVVQEGRAEQALSALRKLAAPEASVRRDGQTWRLPERQLAPGDIVLLEAGSFVPADVRLLETYNLKIDEATLTGEALAVAKDAASILPANAALGDRRNMAYKSTTVTFGRGVGVVVSTGMATEIGHIAALLQGVPDEPTPLQKQLDALGQALVYGALGICAAIFLLAIYRHVAAVPGGLGAALTSPAGREGLRQAALEAFLTSIALAIAAVPEGLPAIVTINLALGMREMIRRHAIIRRLHAVETLGSVSVICSDKTGTLTQNEMTVVRLHAANVNLEVSGDGYAPHGEFQRDGEQVSAAELPDVAMLLTAALLSSDALLEGGASESYRISGDPTEGALVVAAAKAGLHRSALEDKTPRVDEIPFDSARKRMSTLHQTPDAGHLLYVKGAPDVVMERCTRLLQDGAELELTAARREHLHNLNRDLARQALRVIGVAFRRFDQEPADFAADEVENDLIWIGLIAMHDAPRREAAAAIEKARRAGIRTVMITGDYPDTARAVATQIGLCRADGKVITGDAIEKLNAVELATLTDEVSVFARVSPEHKVRIAQAFRARGHIVAMTGDGVNDAPALKAADIGVAMGITGADVTKETADMVLTDDNFASIVGAVEQGRAIYGNIRKFVAFLLGCNLAEIAIILVATLLGYPSPLTPLQILWLNLITDGAPALALGVEKVNSDVMNRPPRDAAEPIVNRRMQCSIAVQTLAIAAVTLAVFFSAYRQSGLEEARCAAFVTLSVTELLVAYSYRSERLALLSLGLWSNRALQLAVGVSATLLACVVFLPFLQPIFATAPLTSATWLDILLLAPVPLLAAETTKWWLRLRESASSKGPVGQFSSA